MDSRNSWTHPSDGIFSRKFGRVLGIVGFIFTTVLPMGARYSRFTVNGGARVSPVAVWLDEMCPLQ